MDKKSVAKILKEIGLILDLKGDNPFKTRAYFNGARIIESLTENLKDLVESGEIANLKGIGQALSDKISTMVKTGNLPYYDELKSTIPDGLLEMIKIPGLGAKKVKIIYDKLGITSVGELEYACQENRLRDLEGFGEKSQQNILAAIVLRKKYNERFLYPIALEESEKIKNYLRKNKKIIQLEVAGSLRRKLETIKDIDIVCSCLENDREKIMNYFVDFPEKISVISKGGTKSAITLESGINCDLRLVKNNSFAFLLHHSTGSKEHNTELRGFAKSLGYKMNEYGLFRENNKIKCKTEMEIFAKMNMDYIPPVLRESMGEIELAEKKQLPELYSGEPFYGIFHIHTTYSDGANTISEIVKTCQDLQMQYIGICDHSKSAFYANGLDEKRVKQQFEEIDEINSGLTNFKIFKGIEVDILTDGSLDYSDKTLAEFDFVVASVHSLFNLSEDAMTKRIIKAISNDYVTMLGHPTGRLLLGREPYKVNMEKIIKVAGDLGRVIEINSSPYRLDLDWRLGKLANEYGVKTALNPDAHSIEGLSDYKFGIAIAQKGWFQKESILNTYNINKIENYFNRTISK
jgi:DNA polymerase (family 10)